MLEIAGVTAQYDEDMAQQLLADTRVETLRWAGALPPAALAAWRELIARHGQVPVFCYPEWLLAASAAKAVVPSHLLIIRQGARPIALLALRKRSYFTAEVCAPLAEDFPMLITLPDAETQAWHALARWMRGNGGIRLLSLGRWREEERMAALREAAAAQGAYAYVREVMPDNWIPLPGTWEEYFAGLGKAMRNNLLYRERQTTNFPGSIEIAFLRETDACMAALDEFITLHRRRWQGQRGSYFDNPRNAAFFREAIRWTSSMGYLVMPVLRCSGRTAVINIVFHIPGQGAAFDHSVARDTEAMPGKYSPGTVLFSRTIRWAIEHGIRRLSMGLSAQTYKYHFGGKDAARREVFLASSAADAQLFSRLDPALHILKHLPSELRYYYWMRQEQKQLAQEPSSRGAATR